MRVTWLASPTLPNNRAACECLFVICLMFVWSGARLLGRASDATPPPKVITFDGRRRGEHILSKFEGAILIHSPSRLR